MQVRQRAYLIIHSNTLTPADITALVRLSPTETKERGSRHPGPPPIPRCHLWTLETGIGEMATLEDHLDVLVPVIRDAQERLRLVAASPDTMLNIMIVRHFEEADEVFHEATYGIEPSSNIVRLGGQHPFLGWEVDADVLHLLASCGIGFDVDEDG